MTAATLASELRGVGLACDVEAMDRLAIVIPEGSPDGAIWMAQRETVIALARTHGFSHVALELPDE